MDKDSASQQDDLVKNFDQKKTGLSPKFLLVLLVLIVIGSGSGFVLAKSKSGSSSQVSGSGQPNGSGSIIKGAVFGSNDTKTFKDTAEGTLKKGGISGEGQYHLVRPGGESQYVYLTSSSVDLSLFVDHQIKVWGQTQAAQYAGWLMDVGRVQVE